MLYDFSNYANAYSNRGQRQDGPEDLPEGVYQCQIVRACLKEGKETGNPYFEWEMNVLVGAFAGQKVWKRAMLQTEQNWQYFGWDCDSILVEMNHPNDVNLDTWRGLHIGKAVEVKIKYRTDRAGQRQQNVYFQKPLSIGSSTTNPSSHAAIRPQAPAPAAQGGGGADDLPF